MNQNESMELLDNQQLINYEQRNLELKRYSNYNLQDI